MFENLFDSIFHTGDRRSAWGRGSQLRHNDKYYAPYSGKEKVQRSNGSQEKCQRKEADRPTSSLKQQGKQCRQSSGSLNYGKESVQEEHTTRPQRNIDFSGYPTTQPNSDDSENMFDYDPRFCGRNTVDRPEVAFRTYDDKNCIASGEYRIVPLDATSRSCFAERQGEAVITLPFTMVKDIVVQVSRKGLLGIHVQLVSGEEVDLQYRLPSYYNRGEVRAERGQNAFVVTLPLSSSQLDDLVIVQVQ